MCVRQPAWLTEAWTRSQTPWPGPRPTGRTLAQAAGGGLGGGPASRQPRRRAPQLRHRPLCSSKNIPPQMEARPEVLAPSWRAILDGTDAPGFSHLPALLSPKCSRARFPAKLGVLTHTNPPRAPGQSVALPRTHTKEPSWLRELRIIKGNATSPSAIGSG